MADPYLQADRETQMILEKAARIDFQDWWMAANRFNRHPDDLIGILADPFVAIIQTYGEQAAAAAVDSMILRRSFYDDLTMLPTPTMDEVAEAEQILKSLNWAIWKGVKDGKIDTKATETRLNGVMNRLVLQPWRGTVYKTTVRDGTLYARVPEPGACWFCLMLASRGAVYTRQTVLGVVSEEGKQQLGDRYHDHCRCLGIEVSKAHMDTQLPLVNKELSDLWQQHVGIKTHPGITADKQQEKWKTLITNLKQQATANKQEAARVPAQEKHLAPKALAARRLPPVPGIKDPQYRTGAITIDGTTYKLPPIQQVPGHVLYGWTERPPSTGKKEEPIARDAISLQISAGHRFDSVKKGTLFPKSWSDQKIVDALVETIEDPSHVLVGTGDSGETFIKAYKVIDGVTVYARWKINEKGKSFWLEGFPLLGEDVKMVPRNNKPPIDLPQKLVDKYTEDLSEYKPLTKS